MTYVNELALHVLHHTIFIRILEIHTRLTHRLHEQRALRYQYKATHNTFSIMHLQTRQGNGARAAQHQTTKTAHLATALVILKRSPAKVAMQRVGTASVEVGPLPLA